MRLVTLRPGTVERRPSPREIRQRWLARYLPEVLDDLQTQIEELGVAGQAIADGEEGVRFMPAPATRSAAVTRTRRALARLREALAHQ